MEVFDSPTHYYPSDAMPLDELAYWIAFNRVSGIGPVSFKSLLNYFNGDLPAAWQAGSKELAQAGLAQKAIENLTKLRATSTPQQELEKLERLRIRVITWKDKAYPPLLREIDDSPELRQLLVHRERQRYRLRFSLAAIERRLEEVVGTRLLHAAAF